MKLASSLLALLCGGGCDVMVAELTAPESIESIKTIEPIKPIEQTTPAVAPIRPLYVVPTTARTPLHCEDCGMG